MNDEIQRGAARDELEDGHLVIERDEEEGGYIAYYPDLPGCITYADTVEETAHMAADAKAEWLAAAAASGWSSGDVSRLKPETGI